MEINLINDSGIRRLLKGSGKQVSPEFLDALNDRIQILLVDAVARAEYNHRKTLMRMDV